MQYYFRLIITSCSFIFFLNLAYSQKIDFFAGISHSSSFTISGTDMYHNRSSICPTLGAILYEWKRKKPHRKTGQYFSSSVASLELYQCKGNYYYTYYGRNGDYQEIIYLNKVMLAINYYPVSLSNNKHLITGKLGWQLNFMVRNKSNGTLTSSFHPGYSYSQSTTNWNANNDNSNLHFVPSVCWYFENRLNKHLQLQYRGAFSTIGHLQFGDYLIHSLYTKLVLRYSI